MRASWQGELRLGKRSSEFTKGTPRARIKVPWPIWCWMVGTWEQRQKGEDGRIREGVLDETGRSNFLLEKSRHRGPRWESGLEIGVALLENKEEKEK